MVAPPPPTIFSQRRRSAQRHRRAMLQNQPDAPRYVLADMAEDVTERLSFLRHRPARSLIIGDWGGSLASAMIQLGSEVTVCDPTPHAGEARIEEEEPYPFGPFDFIASLGTLDTLNDLPGALIHARQALAPGGLMIASFASAGSLMALRAAMLAADGDRPSPRMHPMVDVRAGGQLLQRTGFADPVVDSRNLAVRFGSLRQLVADLRAQGLGNALARPGAPLSRGALRKAEDAFLSHADADGKVTEHFAILTISGWQR